MPSLGFLLSFSRAEGGWGEGDNQHLCSETWPLVVVLLKGTEFPDLMHC